MTPKRNQLKNQNDIKTLKLRYKQHLSLLIELFPTWSRDDLLFAMDECQGDFDLTVNRISEGHTSQWQVKKQKKPKFTERPVRNPKKTQAKTTKQKEAQIQCTKPSWASILKGSDKEDSIQKLTQKPIQALQSKDTVNAEERPVQEHIKEPAQSIILESVPLNTVKTESERTQKTKSDYTHRLEKDTTQNIEQEIIQGSEKHYIKSNTQNRTKTPTPQSLTEFTQESPEEIHELENILSSTVKEEPKETPKETPKDTPKDIRKEALKGTPKETSKNNAQGDHIENPTKSAAFTEGTAEKNANTTTSALSENPEDSEAEPVSVLKSEDENSKKNPTLTIKHPIHRQPRRLNQTEAVVLPSNHSVPTSSLNVQFGTLSMSNKEGEEEKHNEHVQDTPFHSTPQPTSYRESVNDSKTNASQVDVVNTEHSQLSYIAPVIYGQPAQPNQPQPDPYIHPYYAPHPAGYTGVEYNSYEAQRMGYYDPYGQPVPTPTNHLYRENFSSIPHHHYSHSLHHYHPRPHLHMHPPLPQQHIAIAENSAPSPLPGPQYNGHPYFHQYYYPHPSYQNSDYYKYPAYGGGTTSGKAYDYPPYEEFQNAANYDRKYNPANHNEMMHKDRPSTGQQSQTITSGTYYLPSHQNYPPFIKQSY